MAEIAIGTLRDNEYAKGLFEFLLHSSEQDKASDFSTLINYIDSMEMQFDNVIKELQDVKLQLAKVQKSPVKDLLLGMVNTIEYKIKEAFSKLDHVKTTIIESATQTLEAAKHRGIAGLNKMAAFLGVHQGLNAMRDDLGHSGEMMENTIKKMQDAAQELRSVGSHIKNAGRILSGKEPQEVSNDKDGHLAAAVLAPMRGTRIILSGMEKTIAAAISKIEHLEQAVEKQWPVPQDLKNEHEVQPNREQYRAEYLNNLDHDFTECKEYLKLYEDIHGEPNDYFQAVMTTVHDRMLEFDDFSDIQIQAISKMEIPLMAVCCCFNETVRNFLLSHEEIDRAVIDMANKCIAMNQGIKCITQEQDNEMEQ